MKTIEKASVGRGTFAKKESKSSPWSERTFTKKETPAKAKGDLDISAFGRLAKAEELKPGMRIYHIKFGYGTIGRIEGPANDQKAVVVFDTLGEKVLLLKFAKLIIPKA